MFPKSGWKPSALLPGYCQRSHIIPLTEKIRFKVAYDVDMALTAIRVIFQMAMDSLSSEAREFDRGSLVFGQFDRGWIKFFSHAA